VAWRLSAKWLGNVKRGQHQFKEDMDLPANLRISPQCYTNSGYDRGHMCPAGDRNKSYEAMYETFLTSNIVPQTSGNNQGPWNDFENYCRHLAKMGKELYIYSGPTEQWATIPKDNKTNMCNLKIAVPKSVWKIALILPEGENDAQRIEKSAEIIAIEIPNNDRIQKGDNWKDFCTTVAAIEQKTGYRFFSALTEPVRAKLRVQGTCK